LFVPLKRPWTIAEEQDSSTSLIAFVWAVAAWLWLNNAQIVCLTRA
jgi:hypothetical protein